MRVQLPLQIKEQIEESIVETIQKAKEVYSGKTRKVNPIPPPPSNVSEEPAKTVINPPNTDPKEINQSTNLLEQNAEQIMQKKMWTIDELFQSLLDLAAPDEVGIINNLFTKLRMLKKE